MPATHALTWINFSVIFYLSAEAGIAEINLPAVFDSQVAELCRRFARRHFQTSALPAM